MPANDLIVASVAGLLGLAFFAGAVGNIDLLFRFWLGRVADARFGRAVARGLYLAAALGLFALAAHLLRGA